MRHTEVRESLLTLVDGLGAGQALPPERALAGRLGASRTTVRKVVDELVVSGRVERRHGIGTFVAGKLATALTATSFSDEMRERGLEPGSVHLDGGVEPAGAAMGRRLALSPRDDVLRVRRLRLAGGEPMAIETLHVPAGLVPGLRGEDLAGASFYDILRESFGLVITEGEQVVEATVTDQGESEVLQVPVYSPAFLFERTSRDQHGRTVEFVRSVYRGDRYRLTASIRGRDSSADGAAEVAGS